MAIRFPTSGSGEDPSLSLPLLVTATTRVLEVDLTRSCFVRGPGQMALVAKERIEVIHGAESCYEVGEALSGREAHSGG